MDKKELLFPHQDIRPTQKEFLEDTSRALKNKQNLLAHAPTGIGKTTILGPALAYALKNNLTVFFITPRHTQHKIAIETLKLIKQKYDLNFNVVDLIGKKWMCPMPGVTKLSSYEFSEYCKDVREKESCQYFLNSRNKIKRKAVLKKLEVLNPLHVEQSCKLCKEEKVCPFEINCELAKKAKVVICDYFHILSPTIRETLFLKTEKTLPTSILVFDESHNLPAKARDLLTSSISTITLDRAMKEAEKFNFQDLVPSIKNIQDVFENLKSKLKLDEPEFLIEKQEFISQIQEYEEIIPLLEMAADEVREKKKRSYLGHLGSFLQDWLGPDEAYARILTREYTKKAQPFLSLSYRCLDPSLATKPLIEETSSIILMSGTLSPTAMYQDLLGFPTETIQKEYPNPFPEKNRLNLIIPTITTKYSLRNNQMYEKIAKECAAISNLIPGNVAIFFPSYHLRDQINNYFQPLSEKTILMEQPGLTKSEKEELIEKFKSYKERGSVILAAASGSLGEGVDLPGDLLKGVLIVGLPLAKPNLETKQLINYYDIKFRKGWDYGYTYPAIITTLQNAGRCIRSKNDRGVVVLLDDRYSWDNYQRCFPSNQNFTITKIPEGRIKEFFGK